MDFGVAGSAAGINPLYAFVADDGVFGRAAGFDSLKGISEDFCVFGDAAGMNPLNALLKYGRAVCGTVVVDVLQTVVTD